MLRLGATGGSTLDLPGVEPVAVAELKTAFEVLASRLHGRSARLMLKLMAIKALAGFNYVRPDQVVAICVDRTDANATYTWPAA